MGSAALTLLSATCLTIVVSGLVSIAVDAVNSSQSCGVSSVQFLMWSLLSFFSSFVFCCFQFRFMTNLFSVSESVLFCLMLNLSVDEVTESVIPTDR